MEWTVPGVGDCTIKVTESAYDELYVLINGDIAHFG